MLPVCRSFSFPFGKRFGRVDAPVMERRNPGHVAIGKAVRIDDAVRYRPGLQNRHRRLHLDIGDRERVNATTAL